MISFCPCYFQSTCLCIYWLLHGLQTDLSCFTEHVAEVTIPGPSLHHHILKHWTRLWTGPNLGLVSIHHPIHWVSPPAPSPTHFWERDPLGTRYDNGEEEIFMLRAINRKKSPQCPLFNIRYSVRLGIQFVLYFSYLMSLWTWFSAISVPWPWKIRVSCRTHTTTFKSLMWTLKWESETLSSFFPFSSAARSN